MASINVLPPNNESVKEPKRTRLNFGQIPFLGLIQNASTSRKHFSVNRPSDLQVASNIGNNHIGIYTHTHKRNSRQSPLVLAGLASLI